MLLGNVIQLPPVNGRYIFEEPAWPDYKKSHVWQSLWDLFTPVKLRYNHRQEGQAEFAEMLKRVARGITLPEDMEMLRTRVFPKNDPRIPKNTLYVFPKLDAVNEYNRKMIGELEGDFDIIEAKNIMPTKNNLTLSLIKTGR